MVVPTGFALPPFPYLLGLTLGLAAVAATLVARRPTISERHVLALVPWVLVGATGHVLYVVGGLPAALRPLAGAPAVYASVAVVAGGAWAGLDTAGRDTPRPLAAIGVAVLAPLLGVAIASAASLEPVWPGLAVVVAGLLAAGTWRALLTVRPDVAATGRVGALVVFAHALDGVSTAVGYDLLGFGEQTPLSAALIEAGHGLPPAAVFGEAWLFVLVKAVVATLVLFAFRGYVRDEPGEGSLFLGLVAAVGFGPGVHNLVLFTIA